MRKLLALAGVALLAGCAYPNPQHVQALNALIGKSETDLLRSYGVPNRTYDSAGHKFLAYSRNRIESIPGDGFGYGGFGVRLRRLRLWRVRPGLRLWRLRAGHRPARLRHHLRAHEQQSRQLVRYAATIAEAGTHASLSLESVWFQSV